MLSVFLFPRSVKLRSITTSFALIHNLVVLVHDLVAPYTKKRCSSPDGEAEAARRGKALGAALLDGLVQGWPRNPTSG